MNLGNGVIVPHLPARSVPKASADPTAEIMRGLQLKLNECNSSINGVSRAYLYLLVFVYLL